MVNENTLRVLYRIYESPSGIMNTSHLRTLPGFNPRIIGALCAGESPNCVVEGTFIRITERGRQTVEREAPRLRSRLGNEVVEEEDDGDEIDLGELFPAEETPVVPEPVLEHEPEEGADQGGLTDIIDILVSRNDAVQISCRLSKSFAEWMKTNGTTTNFVSDRGEEYARNWDCSRDTKYVKVNLQDLDFRSGTIITDEGINPLLMKLAAAQPNRTWKVCYKGLVSNEELKQHCEKLKVKTQRFYLNYVKPIKIRVRLSVVE